MADLATLRQRLEEVETAIHKLMTGTREVQVRVGDMWANYSEAGLKDLRTYRTELLNQIAAAEGRGGRRRILVEF